MPFRRRSPLVTRTKTWVLCVRCSHGAFLHTFSGPSTGVCRGCKAAKVGNCLFPIMLGLQRDLGDYM